MKQAGKTGRAFTALNMVYLMAAFMGLLFFFLACVTTTPAAPAKAGSTTPTADPLLLQTRLILLFLVTMLQLALGIYIQQSANKMALFLQCLSFMLLLAGHIIFIYAFYDTSAMAPTLQISAAVVTGIAIFLHLGVLVARLPFQIKVVMRKD